MPHGSPVAFALPLKWRADKRQSPLRGLKNKRVVSVGDFATSQPAANGDKLVNEVIVRGRKRLCRGRPPCLPLLEICTWYASHQGRHGGLPLQSRLSPPVDYLINQLISISHGLGSSEVSFGDYTQVP